MRVVTSFLGTFALLLATALGCSVPAPAMAQAVMSNDGSHLCPRATAAQAAGIMSAYNAANSGAGTVYDDGGCLDAPSGSVIYPSMYAQPVVVGWTAGCLAAASGGQVVGNLGLACAPITAPMQRRPVQDVTCVDYACGPSAARVAAGFKDISPATLNITYTGGSTTVTVNSVIGNVQVGSILVTDYNNANGGTPTGIPYEDKIVGCSPSCASPTSLTLATAITGSATYSGVGAYSSLLYAETSKSANNYSWCNYYAVGSYLFCNATSAATPLITTIDGYEWGPTSTHPCTYIKLPVNTDTGTITMTNNHFVFGENPQGGCRGGQLFQGNASKITFVIQNNTFDFSGDRDNSNYLNASIGTSSSATFKWNAFLNVPNRALSYQVGCCAPGDFLWRYNGFINVGSAVPGNHIEMVEPVSSSNTSTYTMNNFVVDGNFLYVPPTGACCNMWSAFIYNSSGQDYPNNGVDTGAAHFVNDYVGENSDIFNVPLRGGVQSPGILHIDHATVADHMDFRWNSFANGPGVSDFLCENGASMTNTPVIAGNLDLLAAPGSFGAIYGINLISGKTTTGPSMSSPGTAPGTYQGLPTAAAYQYADVIDVSAGNGHCMVGGAQP